MRSSVRRGATTWSVTHRAIRPGVRCDMTGVRCDTALAKPATRRSAPVVCAQAGPWVGALCTRLSFDSVHCSKSLFETLFMSTVHEVFKKIK